MGYLVCGISVVITVIFEVPLMSYSKSLLQRVGVRGCFAAAVVCYSVRVVGYTLVPKGAWILFFEPLHGITFACYYLATIETITTITPPHLLATGQALISTLRGNTGVLVSSLV